DRDVLLAECLLDGGDRGFGIGADVVLFGQDRANTADAFGRRVDRAGNAAVARRFGRTERSYQLVELQYRQAGLRTDDGSLVVDLPAFSRSGEDNVMMFLIDEDVLDALQAGKEQNRFGQRLLVDDALMNRGVQAS